MTEGNGRRVALVWGAGSTLGKAVALEMARHGVHVALHDDTPGTAAPLPLSEIRDAVRAAGSDAQVVADAAEVSGAPGLAQAVMHAFGRLDYLINLYIPNPEVDTVERVAAYPAALLERCRTVGRAITQGGAIINQAALPSMYAGTRLEDGMPLLRGGITAVTRSACLLFAAAGVRVNFIQTGFLNLPETRAFATEKVMRTPVPIGRWSTADGGLWTTRDGGVHWTHQPLAG